MEYKENEIVGMGRLIGDGIYDTIVDVIVHPDYQKKGIGKLVFKDFLKKERHFLN